MLPAPALAALQRFQAAGDAKAKARLLLEYAAALPPFPDSAKVDANRVMGCTAQVGPGAGRGPADAAVR